MNGDAGLTERDVLHVLRKHYAARVGGHRMRYVMVTHVRSHAGLEARRTFDAVLVDTWPSQGLTLTVVEVKVSRSDWLRELAQPEKARDACALADRFLVAAPKGVVRPAELLDGWGLFEVDPDNSFGRVVRAPKLLAHHATTGAVPRGFVVSLLRAQARESLAVRS